MRMPTLLPTSLPMSPSQVSHATGASRRTIMRAVEAGELEAFRDNRNHWKITAQAVEKWALAQIAPSGRAHPITVPEPPSAHVLPTSIEAADALAAERQARRLAEVEAAELRGKLIATEAERDRLHGIIQSLTAQKAKRRGWWPWQRS